MGNTTVAFGLASLLVGCATTDDVEVGTTEQDSTTNNGTSLNGTSLNGTSLNGTSLNGTSLNGTSLNGTSLNGTSLNGTSLNGTSLNGTSLDGSTWTGTLSDGSTIILRIDGSTTGTGSNSDVGMYGVSYQTSAGWNPLCGLDANSAPILALAVPGVWTGSTLVYQSSTTQFTWACRAKTIAKCVELGYKPWLGYGDHLATCVRLLRGDYCGDGTTHTVDGQLLDIWDNVGIQKRSQQLWIVEAAWDAGGANCVSNRAQQRFTYLGLATPSCVASGVVPTSTSCGTTFNGGTLIIDAAAESAFGTKGTTATTSSTTTMSTTTR